MSSVLSQFVKQRRRQANLTQGDLAYKAGVGLRFVRDLEQGKPTLRLDKVNQVLVLFNHEVGPIHSQVAIDKTDHNDEP
jgi:y4mF family transcriptional regulator